MEFYDFSYKELKNMEIVRIFDYYNFPLFFISKSKDGLFFLNYYIQDDEWFFCRITNREYLSLIQQSISVLFFLNNLKDKRRLHILTTGDNVHDEQNINIALVDELNFDPESFPTEDFFVEYDYVTNTELMKVEEDIIDGAKFKMVLKDENNNHDISLDVLINVCSLFKELVNGFFTSLGEKMFSGGNGQRLNLKVDSLEPSSFGIWFTTESSDLFSVSDKSINNLFVALEDVVTKSQRDLLDQIEIDEILSLDNLREIQKLFKEIRKNNYTFKLLGTKKGSRDRLEVSFDKNDYQKIDLINKLLVNKNEETEKIIEVEGELISINIRRKTFKISLSDKEIDGKLSNKLLKAMDNGELQFKIPSKIFGTLKEKIATNHLSEEQKIGYELLDFIHP